MKADELKEKNIRYFEVRYPAIAKMCRSYTLKNGVISLTPAGGFGSIQFGQIQFSSFDTFRSNVRIKVESYLKSLDCSPVRSLKLPREGDFRIPRFFSKKMDDLIGSFPEIVQSSIEQGKRSGHYTEYINTRPLSCVLVVGSLFGVLPDEVVKQSKISRLCIIESNLDIFYASLYITDWKKIGDQFDSENGEHLHFILGKPDDQPLPIEVIWRYLNANCPFYPYTTHFIGRNDSSLSALDVDEATQLLQPSMEPLLNYARSNLAFYLASWGNYDDEINQFNQVIHNVKSRAGILPDNIKMDEQIPVCIVGSGPSLDERINELRECQEFGVVVSCGSSITALYKYGICPDIHVELESDYKFAIEALEKIDDDAYIEKIGIIAPLQISPYVVRRFSRQALLLKYGGIIAQQFRTVFPTLEFSGPTCLNFAMSIMRFCGAKNIFLFGADLGFQEDEQHHSKATLYYENELDPVFDKYFHYRGLELHSVKSVKGDSLRTEPLLLAAKSQIEYLVGYDKGLNVYNCSNGADIEGTTYLEDSRGILRSVNSLLSGSRLTKEKQRWVDSIFNGGECIEKISTEIVVEFKSRIYEALTKMNEKMLELLNAPFKSVSELQTALLRINRWMENELLHESRDIYQTIRGTLYLSMSVAWSHVTTLYRNDEERLICANQWREAQLSFPGEILTHAHSILEKNYETEDLLLSKSIYDPE